MNDKIGGTGRSEAGSPSHYEIIDCRELGRRWCLPESWVRAHVRDGITEPIPHLRFGRYVRFRWGSPELNSWLERRTVTGSRSARLGR